MEGIGIIVVMIAIIALIVFFMFHIVPSQAQFEEKRLREEALIKQQAREALKQIEQEKLYQSQPIVNIHTQEVLISSLRKEQAELQRKQEEIHIKEEEAIKVLERLHKQEEFNKLSKEELFEKVYAKESDNSLENLSPEEVNTILGVLTKIRGQKE